MLRTVRPALPRTPVVHDAVARGLGAAAALCSVLTVLDVDAAPAAAVAGSDADIPGTATRPALTTPTTTIRIRGMAAG